ncbi:hypothetical protein K438DRAFT_1904995 [Mycena galopus ATCC 62051]|nr:hypothetical protein K438DRAFT_1904995 [Mycena galopus ATCC 62051]
MPPHRLPSLGLESPPAAADLDGEQTPPIPTSVRSRTTSTANPSRPRVSTLLSGTAPTTRTMALLTVTRHRRVLASLLRQMSWRACRALFSTCRDFRDFFSDSELKDVILSRFVPRYSACARISDPLRLQNVPITLADLNLLLISQAIILHRYPMHALTCISGLAPEDPDEWDRTSRLVTLTQAHSRFVLLLQALAHSSTLPPNEKEEYDSPTPVVEPKLRQLTFPAPLSRRTHAARQQGSTVTGTQAQPLTPLSLFGNGMKNDPPPPASVPLSLKYYTLGWRHSLSQPSGSVRFASTNPSSDSSSYSGSPSPPFSRDSTFELSSPVRRGIAHHDLSLATSRTRAPILRVFVPCSRMDLSDDSDSIALCEDQLYDSDCDIVCNLGYPPRLAGDEHDLQNRRKWLIFNGRALVPFSPPESLPLRNVFTLPSPFYYMHIMPPLSDPVFTVRCFPPCDDIPQLSLVTTFANGVCVVKKPMWTARVWKQVAQDDEIGLGWQGEWVLEGEGTREGQKVLLDCLRGVRGPLREWQLVREKSGGDRLWFRLIKTFLSKRNNAKKPTTTDDSEI